MHLQQMQVQKQLMQSRLIQMLQQRLTQPLMLQLRQLARKATGGRRQESRERVGTRAGRRRCRRRREQQHPLTEGGSC